MLSTRIFYTSSPRLICIGIWSEDKKSCKNKEEFLVSIFGLLRVLGIFGRLRAILEKKNMARLRACLHGGGVPQIGEVTRLGGVTRLSI